MQITLMAEPSGFCDACIDMTVDIFADKTDKAPEMTEETKRRIFMWHSVKMVFTEKIKGRIREWE